MWIGLPSKKAFNHNSGRSGGGFGVLFVVLILQQHPCIQQDGVSCHPAYLLMLNCALSRHIANGKMQWPQNRVCLLCEMA